MPGARPLVVLARAFAFGRVAVLVRDAVRRAVDVVVRRARVERVDEGRRREAMLER